MYWTLELASNLEDAPWPATKDELIDFAIRSGAPMEVIENLLYINFGDFKTTVILWWVFDRISPEGEEYGLMDENEVEHHIRTPKQLYKFLKKYE